MKKIRSNRVARVFWMIVQAGCAVAFGWAGYTMPTVDLPRLILVPLSIAMGFFFGLALTVLWTLLYELFCFTLPALIRSGAQKIHRRHSL